MEADCLTRRRLFMQRKRFTSAGIRSRADAGSQVELDPEFLRWMANVSRDVSMSPPAEQKKILLREVLNLITACKATN
jgi:hypothetical protein